MSRGSSSGEQQHQGQGDRPTEGREPAPEQHGTTPRVHEATVDTSPQHADAHELPHESLSPITLAAGIGLLGFGLLTSPVFSIVGIVTMAWALASWIKEIRHG
jgi:hypothetical protein